MYKKEGIEISIEAIPNNQGTLNESINPLSEREITPIPINNLNNGQYDIFVELITNMNISRANMKELLTMYSII